MMLLYEHICVQQQEFEYSGSYKAAAFEVANWAKSYLPNSLA